MTTQINTPSYNINIGTKMFFSRLFNSGVVYSVLNDSTGNIYASIGSSSGITNGGGTLLNSLGSAGGYLVKFNSSGTYQWSRYLYGSPLGSVYSCLDSTGDVYVSGVSTGTLYINDGETGQTLATLGGSAYLAKFNTSGTFLFGRTLSGVGTSTGNVPSCDSTNNVYMCGSYNSAGTSILDQNGTTIGTLPNPASGNSSFVIKFNSAGTYQYARIIDTSTANSVSGDLYIAGKYTGTPSIRDQSGTVLGNLPAGSGFCTKFNSSGALQYSFVFDGGTECYTVFCDQGGNIYVGGYYGPSASVTIKSISNANVSTTISTLPLTSGQAGFLSKFDSYGTIQYSRIFDGTSASVRFINGLDGLALVFCCGNYTSSLTVKDTSNSTLVTFPTSNSSQTGFVSCFTASGIHLYSRILDPSIISTISSNSLFIGGNSSGSSVYVKDQDGTQLNMLTNTTGFISKFISTPYDIFGNVTFGRMIDASVSDFGYAVTCDNSKNVYIAGTYTLTSPKIYDNYGTVLATLPNSVGGNSAFASKFDSIGNYQYSIVVDSAGADDGNGIFCDGSGNMYITGSYTGTANVKLVSSSNIVSNVGTFPTSSNTSAFVSKFSSSGIYQYSRIVEGLQNDVCNRVTCDPSGNVYICGYYTSTTVTANIKTVSNTNVVANIATLPTTFTSSPFVSKFDSSGVYLYSRVIRPATAGAADGVDLCTDTSGNVYICGYYTSASNIVTVSNSNVVSNVATLPSVTTQTGFMSKFGTTGSYLYSRLVDSTGSSDGGTGVVCDNTGSVYMVGYYSAGTVTIKTVSNSNTVVTVATLPGSQSAFLSKFDAGGVYQYSRTIDTGTARAITCDPAGNIYIVSSYSASGNVRAITSSNSVSNVSTLPDPYGSTAQALTKFDSSGNYQNSIIIELGATDWGLSCDSDGNICVAGQGTSNNEIVFRTQTGTGIGYLPGIFSTNFAYLLKFDSTGRYIPATQPISNSTFSRVLTSTGADTGLSVACDSTDTMYFGGYYTGTAILKNQAGTSIATLPSNAAARGFMCRFDSSGGYKYTRTIESSSNVGADQVNSIACDASSNVYMSGTTRSSSIITNQVSSVSLVTFPTFTGNIAGFMSKFDSYGVPLYSACIDGTTAQDEVTGVACDASSNVYMAGTCGSSSNIRIISNTGVVSNVASLPSSGGAFLAKYNSVGTYLYTRTITSTGTDSGNGTVCDASGNVYLVGTYGAGANIQAVTNSNVVSNLATLPSVTTQTGFMSKFDSVGNYQYSVTIDSSATTDSVNGAACDSSGNVYIVGSYGAGANICIISNSNVVSNVGTLPTVSTVTAFASKFDANGNYQYSVTLDGTGADNGYGAVCDSTNNVYITGTLGGNSNIRIISNSNVVSNVGTYSVGPAGTFSLKFNPGGVYYYSRIVTSISGGSGAGAISCDSNNNVYLTGFYSTTSGLSNIVTLSNSNVFSNVASLPTSSGVDAFVTKFDSDGNYNP